MSSCKLFIFDMDGTIVNSEKTVTSIFNVICSQLGRPPLSLEQSRPYISMGGAEMIEAIFGPNVNTVEILQQFRELYLTCDLSGEDLYPGVRTFINNNKSRGRLVALCTNKPRNLTIKVLDFHGLTTLFDRIVTGCDVAARKPAPEGLLHILKALKVSPLETLFFGDSRVDIQAAKEASIPFYFHDQGYDDGVNIMDAKHVFQSYNSLIDLAL